MWLLNILQLWQICEILFLESGTIYWSSALRERTSSLEDGQCDTDEWDWRVAIVSLLIVDQEGTGSKWKVKGSRIRRFSRRQGSRRWETNFHVRNCVLTKCFADMCLLSNNIHDYYNVAQGKITIPNVDDGEECLLTDVSPRYYLGRGKTELDALPPPPLRPYSIFRPTLYKFDLLSLDLSFASRSIIIMIDFWNPSIIRTPLKRGNDTS